MRSRSAAKAFVSSIIKKLSDAHAEDLNSTNAA